jgi:hemin uptake protein HemP
VITERTSAQEAAKQTPETVSTKTAPVLRVNTEQLLGGSRELLIEHRGETYRLSVTRSGKLNLTK